MSADYRDQDLVVVAHAGTIRAALALALEIPLNAALNMAISNLSLTRIDAFPMRIHTPGGSTVLTYPQRKIAA